ncbi:MAG: 30S ribosomal protein S16 [bacterium]
MAVVVRLQRNGKPKHAHYRVVAIEKTRGASGEPLEVLGHYNPKAEKGKDKIILKSERLEYWIKTGAKPSETVASLIKLAGKAEAK